ncbi:MAG: PKD domain-containing protein [Bryobacteraceae bacterium]|nr:PKD domain-containing protein [Bryobacteraceae bacterium]
MERPEVVFRVYQFPANQIPRIDGQTNDWAMVPESYSIGIEQLKDTVNQTPLDRKDLDVKVKVGWVKGLNRLYFLYEASDNYWDFRHPDLHNDIFELVVDGDLSGGPFIKQMHPLKGYAPEEAHFTFHGVHAQNYHIFTPPGQKDWAMVWGCQPWIKQLPYANAAYDYRFQPGQGGKLNLEFYITPFDYAAYEGPGRSVESKLWENKKIGMSWAVLDYDDDQKKTYRAFWNLSHKTSMYGNASDLVAFQLMPLEKPDYRAAWSFTVLDMDQREVAFHDDSTGATSWKWDFGDGQTSVAQHPIHRYAKAGEYVVILSVDGPGGKSQLSKVWDVVLR